jgi:hypothetical protein
MGSHNSLTASQLQRIVAGHNVLIIHFSTTDAGSPPKLRYPKNLSYVLNRMSTHCCCSTISPADSRDNALSATRGVILYPAGPKSIKGVGPNDIGSDDLPGGIKPEYREVSARSCAESITERGPGGYNEWVLAKYQPFGMFFFQNTQGRPLSHDLAEMKRKFPNQAIFTKRNGQFAECLKDGSLMAVTAKSVYGL